MKGKGIIWIVVLVVILGAIIWYYVTTLAKVKAPTPGASTQANASATPAPAGSTSGSTFYSTPFTADACPPGYQNYKQVPPVNSLGYDNNGYDICGCDQSGYNVNYQLCPFNS